MTKDDGRRKMGEGPQDDSACTKRTMPGPRTKEWPHLYTNGGGLVKTELQVLQQGDGQGSM